MTRNSNDQYITGCKRNDSTLQKWQSQFKWGRMDVKRLTFYYNDMFHCSCKKHNCIFNNKNGCCIIVLFPLKDSTSQNKELPTAEPQTQILVAWWTSTIQVGTRTGPDFFTRSNKNTAPGEFPPHLINLSCAQYNPKLLPVSLPDTLH